MQIAALNTVFGWVCFCFFVFLRSSIIAYVTVFNSGLRHLDSHIPSSGVQVHAGYFRVFIIHRTLTWTTGSLTSVHGLSYARVYTTDLKIIFLDQCYTHGCWAHRQRVSTTFMTEKLKVFLSCAPDGIRTLDLWISSTTL